MLLEEFLSSKNFGFRIHSFRFLANWLLSLKRPVLIIETGSMRPGSTPQDDGHSTLLWDYVVETAGGACFSVDINPLHTAHTQSQVGNRTKAFTSDSLKCLTSLTTLQPIDLLYLDSMDWKGTEQERLESSLHHIGELAALWPQLVPGSMIAVDDCLGRHTGKHALIECFFDLLKVQPCMIGPVYAWQKPCSLS